MPDSSPDKTLRASVKWALLGNDENGIYGTEVWRAGRPNSLTIAVLWWLRNPFHNLFWHVLNIPNDKDPSIWPDRGFKGRWKPPFVAYRGKYVEWYAGFRSQQGVLGACLRKSKSAGS